MQVLAYLALRHELKLGIGINMNSNLPPTFESAAIESRWYSHWEENGRFRPKRPSAEPFTIVNPPPNVTGSLHIGHALDNTLQDIIIRQKGYEEKMPFG